MLLHYVIEAEGRREVQRPDDLARGHTYKS